MRKTLGLVCCGLLFCCVAVFAQPLAEYHFRAGENNPHFALHNGAEFTPEGYLRLNGNGAYAELTETKDLVLNERGMTFVAVVRPNAWKDTALLYQDKSYCLGTTASGRYFLSTAYADNDNAGYLNGLPTAKDRGWDFLVVNIERHLNEADGINGYRLSIAVNDEVIALREINNLAVNMSNSPILLGKGLQTFAGDIAGLHIYRRILKDSEIEELEKNCGVAIKPAGNQNLQMALLEEFRQAQAKAALPEAKWLISCLEGYAGAGAEVEAVRNLLAQAAPACQATTRDDLVARWNGNNRPLRLLATDNLLLLLADHGFGTPVLGAFNLMTGTPMFQYDGFSWALEYENLQKEPFNFAPSSANMEYTVDFGDNGAFTVTWQNQDWRVELPVVLDAQQLKAQLKVNNLNSGHLLVNVAFPRVTLLKLPGEDRMIFPRLSGVIFKNPTNDFLIRRWHFPSDVVAMQMTGYYNTDEQGIYLGYEDPLAASKNISLRGRAGFLIQEWINHVPFQPDGKSGGNSFDMHEAYAVLRPYHGDWYECGQIYKEFLSAKAAWWIPEIPRQDTPKWFMNNALWIGSFDPDENGLPIEGFRYLNEYFTFPPTHTVGFLGACNGPWRFGPDYCVRGGIHLPETLEQAHAMGNHVFPYYNSRLWYCGDTADQENKWTERGKASAVYYRDGNVATENYGTPHAVMCPATTVWQEHLKKQIKKIAESGLDGIYHDQLPCAEARLCFATDHQHLPGDPHQWLSEGHWLTYEDYVMKDLRQEYPNLAHTGEEASDPFLKCLDGYMTWRFGFEGHVPLFQSVYAPRVQFVGRFCYVTNPRQSGYNVFFAKYGEQLAYGEQIGNANINTVRFPSPFRAWLKKISLARIALADFLNSAEMQKMLKFQEPIPQLTDDWGVVSWKNMVTWDKVLHSVWKHKDGRVLVMFINTTNETLTIRPQADRFQGYALTVMAEGKQPQDFPAGALAPAVDLKPYEIRFWLLNNGQPDAAWAKSLTPLMQNIATTMDDLGLNLNQPVDFTKRNELDASKHEFLRIKDASWFFGAHRCVVPFLDYDPKTNPDNWAVCPPDSLIYFGVVDFGAEAKTLAGEFAAYQQGVTVEVVNLTNNQAYEVLATFALEPGGWYDYKTVTTKTVRPLHGKLDIALRVKGGNCNIRGWKVEE